MPARTPAVPAAQLEGPITVGTPSPPADPKPVDLAGAGYLEEEWFASGTASTFAADGEPPTDGTWKVKPAGTAPYKTRFIVRRPADPAKFSGTVVVEWLNVSAVEASPEWTYTNEAITSAGAAYLGVSVQALGIVGGPPLIDTGVPVKGIRDTNPQRYGSLVHPGDQYAFDIYSQIAAAVRSPGGAGVVGGAKVARVVAAGESQSAGYIAGYINGIQPVSQAFDGFLVHSRGSGAALPDGSRPIRGDDVAYRLRTDLGVPVMVFETETDVGPLLKFAKARQPDNDLLRVWEVAGTAHADAYLVGRSFGLCPGSINDGPQHYVVTAAMDALLRWVADGSAPPQGEPIRTGGADGVTVQRDAHGNALGGIRTPAVEVPLSTITGEAPSDAPLLCRLFGSSRPFDAATIQSLYPSRDAYLQAFDAALDKVITQGFVRPADRGDYAAEARAAFPG